LDIIGMSCNRCIRHVGDALRGVAGVASVDVELGRAQVVHDDAIDAHTLIAAIAAAGYEARHDRPGSRLQVT
jgi:copper chaperone CopZ